MAEVLVTGGTGMLGSALVPALKAAGHTVRVLSRRPGEGRVVGDLATGAGLDEATRGVRAVVHAASDGRGNPTAVDIEGTRRLAVAAREAGAEHLLYVSIPGVDRIPLAYYRAKFAAEQIVAAAGIPYTVERISQFHPLVGTLLKTLHRGPVLPVPAGWRVEPVAVADVAAHLTGRVGGGPVNGIAEFGGPQAHDAADLARTWLQTRGERGYVVPVPAPGKLSKSIQDGANLVGPAADRGTISWAAWLASPAAAQEVARYAGR